jgi:hypothetical protein
MIPPDARDETERRLLEWAAREGHTVTPDGFVCERVAALMLGYRGPGALRQQHSEGRVSPLLRWRRVGSRRWYEVRSIADFLMIEANNS